MPAYVYKARDTAGKRVSGTMAAGTQEELVAKLHRMGYMTTQVKEAPLGIPIASALDRWQGVGTEDMILFNVQLANLINAGISLLASLDTLSRQIENKRLKEAIADVSRGVQAGENFSGALERHPAIFSKLFISMIKVAEASGKLDQVLIRFAAFSEHQADLRQKIQGAFFYPLILLAACLGVSLFIVTTVIPQFAVIFMKAGIALPLPTLILYHAGRAIQQFWLSIILFLLLAVLGIQTYAGTKGGKFQIDRLSLSLPLFGSLFRKAAISRFGRTLATLLSSGVPILQSLEIVREVIGNEVLARVLSQVHEAVEKGEGISETLKISSEFPPDAVQLIEVGEETGKLDEMLGKVSDFYDRSLEYSLKKLTTILEPLLLVMMGTLIGLIMASMLLPIFDMMKVLRR